MLAAVVNSSLKLVDRKLQVIDVVLQGLNNVQNSAEFRASVAQGGRVPSSVHNPDPSLAK